jgi:DNA ligase OB-like domain
VFSRVLGAAMFKKGKKYIGKMLTVKFFEYTDEGIPRFPTTIRGGEADMRID